MSNPRLKLLDETTRIVCPVRLVLSDSFTAQAPIGRLNPVAEQLAADGVTWNPVPVRPQVSASGVLAYPNLGLVGRMPATGVKLHYRLTLDPDYYRPKYLKTVDAIAFDVDPFNHRVPDRLVMVFPTIPVDFGQLIPNARYPFPAHVTVLYGQVVRAGTNTPAANIAVDQALTSHAQTDNDGRFALPLKMGPTTSLSLDLSDRSGTTKTVGVPEPWENRTKYLKAPLVF